jgi:hypothetical protein
MKAPQIGGRTRQLSALHTLPSTDLPHPHPGTFAIMNCSVLTPALSRVFRVSKYDYHDCNRGSKYPKCVDD